MFLAMSPRCFAAAASEPLAVVSLIAVFRRTYVLMPSAALLIPQTDFPRRTCFVRNIIEYLARKSNAIKKISLSYNNITTRGPVPDDIGPGIKACRTEDFLERDGFPGRFFDHPEVLSVQVEHVERLVYSI